VYDKKGDILKIKSVIRRAKQSANNRVRKKMNKMSVCMQLQRTSYT
jgi:hypothetical protein